VIRPAVETDVPELIAMIRELAAFEDLADQVQITEDALGAYERAGHPKRLVTVPGTHYAVYAEQFERTSREARDWFVAHLSADT